MRLLFALIVLPACAGEVTTTVEKPIIGGQSATHAEFPTVVALQNGNQWGGCTGTLVDKDWVLSAAHCVEGETTTSLRIRFDDANVNDATGGTEVAVAAIHAKPDWVDPVWDNDIALIRLATSVTDREPTPIDRGVVAPGTALIAVGYGDSDDNGNGSGILRKLPSYPTIDCAGANDPEISGDNLLCFDPTKGQAGCDGDSGGPAFITVEGKLRVVGANSGTTGDTCTEGWELYTSVAGELAFIDMYLPPTAPDPDSPDSPEDPPKPDDPELPDEDGGCQVTSSVGGTVFVLALLALRRRRRRR